jgi:hypothetical protein
MTDKKLTPTDPHHVLPTFVNSIVGSGHFGGVANLTFAVAQFTPETGGTIAIDQVINCRLRMDMNCVKQLRDACDYILQEMLKPTNGTTH